MVKLSPLLSSKNEKGLVLVHHTDLPWYDEWTTYTIENFRGPLRYADLIAMFYFIVNARYD